MIKIGPDLLTTLGLDGMTRSQAAVALKDIYNTLELRVGKRMARKMTDLQLAQFEKYFANSDDKGALEWLTKNVPDYRETVQEEFDLLLARVRAAVQEQRGAVPRPAANNGSLIDG